MNDPKLYIVTKMQNFSLSKEEPWDKVPTLQLLGHIEWIFVT
jgi:hypothetical protein